MHEALPAQGRGGWGDALARDVVGCMPTLPVPRLLSRWCVDGAEKAERGRLGQACSTRGLGSWQLRTHPGKRWEAGLHLNMRACSVVSPDFTYETQI